MNGIDDVALFQAKAFGGDISVYRDLSGIRNLVNEYLHFSGENGLSPRTLTYPRV